MLELRQYTKPELSAMFGTRDMEGLKRKMERYGIVFEVTGRGERAVFTICEIMDTFKVFCITELEFDGGTDFKKLLYFFHYFFNDDEFRAMPDEVKEFRMHQSNHPLSRQTIATYIKKLESKDLIDRRSSNFIYYFAYRQTQRVVQKEEYNEAWHNYWNDIDDGYCPADAIRRMRAAYGGVARKQAIPEFNGIYNDQLEYLCSLVCQGIEKEIGGDN